MRKKIMAFVFAAALLVALAVPLFSGGTALATGPSTARDAMLPSTPVFIAPSNPPTDVPSAPPTAGSLVSGTEDHSATTFSAP